APLLFLKPPPPPPAGWVGWGPSPPRAPPGPPPAPPPHAMEMVFFLTAIPVPVMCPPRSRIRLR
ncbi:hypothetical protein, partial [Nocardia abscessus]|uniref:hypothetical protein n=1 Tax=Nocardia abscessus TaxID=120957 RepID=UPI002457901F